MTQVLRQNIGDAVAVPDAAPAARSESAATTNLAHQAHLQRHTTQGLPASYMGQCYLRIWWKPEKKQRESL